jgi:tRNA (cytidine/uridine-2'-O-)-methyltransferase
MRRPNEPFHVVLVEPEIPQNTGSIARLCAATASNLHLVGRLGFRTDEKAVRRAGLDYCLEKIGCKNPLLFTSKNRPCYLEAQYHPGDALVFGKETKGLSQAIMDRYSNGVFAIPTIEGSVRSLNLANAVSVVVYEALRATGALSITFFGL